MFTRSVCLALCLAVVAFTGTARAAVMRTLQSGVWKGASYSNDETGKFDHCAAGVPYKSGVYMIVSIGRNFSWELRFTDPYWTLAQGEKIPVVVTFDGGAPWTGTAVASSKVAVALPMVDDSSLVRAFRAGRLMGVDAAGQQFYFSLGGTSRLLLDLAYCVRSELARERGEPLPAYSNSAARPATQAPPIAGSSTAKAELELAAARIATNLLLEAKLPNARLLSPAETPESVRNLGVAWRSDVGFGTVELLSPTQAGDAQHVASQLIESDATTCKGDFASGRSSELVDNDVVTKAFTGCKDSAGAREVRYFVLHKEGGPFIVYAVVGNMGAGQASPTTSKINDRDFQAAAVKAAFSPQ